MGALLDWTPLPLPLPLSLSPREQIPLSITLHQTATVRVSPNPEEVQAVKYVTPTELQAMMDPSSGLLWSPWFRIIAERFLPQWWKDLPATLATNKHVDPRRIHCFDPPQHHMGGAGNAGPYLDAANGRSKAGGNGAQGGDQGKKQGAYGKVKAHSESLVSQLLRVEEVAAALRVKFGSPFPKQPPQQVRRASASTGWLAGSVCACGDSGVDGWVFAHLSRSQHPPVVV